MVCNRSWHLPGNPNLVWHPACLPKEGGCVDLSMNALHPKDPLILFGSEGSALTLPHFLLSPRIIMLCHCSSTMTTDHFLLISYGTNWPLCVDVPLNTHTFILIHSYFHVPVAPKHTKYLCFTYNSRVYNLRMVPIGLSMTLWCW